MTDFDLKNYQPSDTLYLWWLGQPEAPRLIGELRMAARHMHIGNVRIVVIVEGHYCAICSLH